MKCLFTEIAGVYDRMNHVFSLGCDLVWRRKAAARVKGTPLRILDLACGTGDMTLALAGRFPTAEILGADLTPAMLAIARRKNASARIAFAEANAQDLSTLRIVSAAGDESGSSAGFVPASFDLVSCAFGFRNFPDKAAALGEASRAVAPGGQLLVLEFFRPSSRLLGGFTALWLRLLTFLFVRARSANYGYLRASMKATLSVEEFIVLAAAQGFRLTERRFFLPCCTCLLFEAEGTRG